jgi:hypothetical protein
MSGLPSVADRVPPIVTARAALPGAPRDRAHRRASRSIRPFHSCTNRWNRHTREMTDRKLKAT